MTVRFLREFQQALRETPHLKRRYYILSTVVGLVGVGIALGLFFLPATYLLGSVLEIPMNAPINRYENGSLMLVGVLLLIPTSIYAGCAIVAGLVGIAMALLGKMTVQEACEYALYFRHPRHWLRSPRRRLGS